MGGTDIQEKSPHSVTPKPYPVSARAYKKKDYEYLSTFNRTVTPALWKSGRDGEISRHRSDIDSDFSSTFTRSSADSGSSNSFGSSSSTSSFEKLSIDLENHHRFLSDESSIGSLRVAEAKFRKLAKEAGSQAVKSMFKANSEDVEDQPKNHDTNESAGPSGRKPKALPKFGEWDGQDRSSEESYTAIFENIRDQKRSGGLLSHPESNEKGVSTDGNETGCLSNEDAQSNSKQVQLESSLTGSSTEGSCEKKSVPEPKGSSKLQGVRQKKSSLVGRLWHR